MMLFGTIFATLTPGWLILLSLGVGAAHAVFARSSMQRSLDAITVSPCSGLASKCFRSASVI